jgi:dipeptidyl aminopeptidase/acylaminoacyl peptidase
VEVNYGGSTGFGRAYRERLDGGWGVVEVDDCLAAVAALVEAGKADPERVAMEGGSAAGFTVLEALARASTIKAGCCRYPVTDLTALASDAGGHRFEARYFETLVGPWPRARTLYEQRSPLRHPERIAAPVIFFHGLEDPVVPARQTEALAQALRQRNVPVELHLFPGEGHGFRDQSVQVRILEATEAFFRRHLRL